jgi:hypothetical protein
MLEHYPIYFNDYHCKKNFVTMVQFLQIVQEAKVCIKKRNKQ